MLTGLRSHILLRQQESLPRQSEFKQGICSTTRTDACNICGQSQRKFRREVKFDGTFRARTNLSTWRESLSQTKDKIDVALWAVHCHERNKAPDRDSSSRSCPILSETGEISNNGNWMKKTPTLRLECDICYNSMLMLARYTREVRKQKTICHQWAQPYEGRQKKKKRFHKLIKQTTISTTIGIVQFCDSRPGSSTDDIKRAKTRSTSAT